MPRMTPAMPSRSLRARAAAVLAAVAAVAVAAVPIVASALAVGPPTLTGLASPTHPVDTTWYTSRDAEFIWNAPNATPAVDGYSYSLTRGATDPSLDATKDALKPRYAAGTASYAEATHSWMPERCAVADYNNDGKLDMAWTASHRAFVMLGNGDGTFQTPASFLEPEYLAYLPDIAAADFNADGKMDLAFPISSYTKKFVVTLGNGDGTFGPMLAVPSTAWTTSWDVCPADFDGDGKTDLAVAYQSGPPRLEVYKGNGDGTFAVGVPYAIPAAVVPDRIAAGDLTGDGRPEIVTTAWTADKVTVFTNDGSGGFSATAPLDLATPPNPRSVAVADMTGDGRSDIVVGNMGTSGSYGEPLTLFVNGGSGTFTRRGIAGPGNAQLTDMWVTDMNCDGVPDVAAYDNYSYTGEGAIELYLNDGSGNFPSPYRVITPYPNARHHMAVGDFDRSGIKDAVVVDATAGEALIPFLGNAGAAISAPDDGTWYFHVRGVSGATGGPTSDRRIRIDTAGPDVKLTGVTDGGTYMAGAVLSATLTASDPNMPDASGVAELHWTSSWGASGEVSGGTTAISVPSTPGTYSFNAHAHDNAGNQGPPSYFTVYVVGGVTELTSPTHPDQNGWYLPSNVQFLWKERPDTDYSFQIDRDPNCIPDLEPDPLAWWPKDDWGAAVSAAGAEPVASGPSAAYTGLASGTWYFHVREVSASGESGGPVSTVRVNIGQIPWEVAGPISKIQFRGNSWRLSSWSKYSLRKLAEAIKAGGYTEVRLEGFTAWRDRGSSAFRNRLASTRARMVKVYLESRLKKLGVSIPVTAVGIGAVPGSGQLQAADRKVLIYAR